MTKTALVITPFVWDAGAGKGKPTVAYLIRGLQRAGWQVHVLAPTNRRDAPAETEGAVVHSVRLPWDPARQPYDVHHSFLTLVRNRPAGLRRHLIFRWWWLQVVLVSLWHGGRLARRLKPDLVYGVNNPGIPPAWWIARRHDAVGVARVMGTMIGRWAPRPDDGAVARARRALGRWLLRFDELLALRLPLDLLVVTDDGSIDRAALNGWLRVPDARVRLLRNGIDKRIFQAGLDRAAARTRLGLPADAPMALWVSQLVDWKRTDRLIDAWPTVRARLPDALLLIVGDGPARGALESRATDRGVADAVRFAGVVSREAVVHGYAAADLFVALYDHSNVSNTLLEAMLSGLPVVTLDNGTTAEVVSDPRHGRLLSPDAAPQTIAEAVLELLADEPRRAAAAEAATLDADAMLLTWGERIDREIAEIERLVRSRASDASAPPDPPSPPSPTPPPADPGSPTWSDPK